LEEIQQERNKRQRAYLVGVQDITTNRLEADDHLAELASLTDTMGAEVVGTAVARIDRPTPNLYLGQGKSEEIKALALAAEADVLIFDVDLSPSQQRNWEKFAEVAVIDRQEVILDIFAGRAQTKEARLQVGLARMEYSLPRLRRQWTHLERQRGGAGLRGGPGELQLEVDRRVVTDRIRRFKQQLAEVRKQRRVQRKSRKDRPVPTAAIVGYTNVGKSSLLKRLTGADVLVEDKLFATLDTTTRRIMLANNQPLLLTDTVGFIRRLPHQLVEAFKATLEEAIESDYLIQVLDVTHPKIDEHFRVTNQVLAELGAEHKKMIVVLNKIDQEYDPLLLVQFRAKNPLTYAVSTRTGEGLEELKAAFAEHFTVPMRRARLHLPQDRFDLLNLLHREGTIYEERYENDGAWLDAEYPVRYEKEFAGMVIERAQLV
jgi:GTP-binding protein HflX